MQPETLEQIITRCLARVPNDVDKREGSIIYDALAPACAELAQMQIILSVLIDRAFLDTATGNDLTMKASEFSIFRLPATAAVRQGEFIATNNAPMDVPLGSRFSGGDLNYIVTAKIEVGIFELTCETEGTIGNDYSGQIIPIDYITGLAIATLTEVLIPGEDVETDDHLRQRVYDALEGQAFGGNIADYKQKTLALPGVGQVKVYPIWNGGGTVKLAIVDSEGNVPSDTLIDSVQTAIDPEVNQGIGLGIAPIGHVVTVVGAQGEVINIASYFLLQDGYTWEMVLPGIQDAIKGYFADLIVDWSNNANTIVRISQLETRILDVQGILDIHDTTINGVPSNYVVGGESIPTLGEVAEL